MPYLLAGPFVALVGILAVFFVLRRKSVEKRSMYSARRSQIEHKVRAARQRTLTPRSHSKPAEQTIPAEAPSPFATQAAQTVAYQAPAYEAPPVAPPAPSQFPEPQRAPSASPWDVPAAAAAAPAPPSFDYPVAPPEPAYTPPAPEPAYTPPAAPAEPVWTPAPEPAPPAERLEPAAQQTAAAAASAGSWSIVSSEKESATASVDGKRKKDKGGVPTSWELASGEAPGAEAEEPELKRSNATLMAVAQYAVLVVGLVMVLIGVIVMVANSHVT